MNLRTLILAIPPPNLISDDGVNVPTSIRQYIERLPKIEKEKKGVKEKAKEGQKEEKGLRKNSSRRSKEQIEWRRKE